MNDTIQLCVKEGERQVQVENLLAAVELFMIEVTDHLLTSSDFTQEIPFTYLSEFSMSFHL